MAKLVKMKYRTVGGDLKINSYYAPVSKKVVAASKLLSSRKDKREVKNMRNKYVTEQEAEKIKMLIARGLTNKEIAIVLQRSPETVRRIRAGVWEKYKEERREKYNAKKEAVKEHEKTETDELKVTDYLQAMLDKQDKISTQLELIMGMLK